MAYERGCALRGLRRHVLDWTLSFPMFVKILGIGVLAVTLFAVLTLLLMRSSTTRSLHALLQQRTVCTATFLASQLEEPLAAGDRAAIDQRLRRARESHPDLRFATVLDRQGRIVTQASSGPIPKELAQTSGRVPSRRDFRVVQGSEGAFFAAVEPIGQGPSGWLQVGLSDELVNRQGDELTRLIVVGLIPCLLLAAGLAALLAHLVTRPIERLVQAANRIGEGNFDVRADAICNDEIGHLAGAFNHMAERLGQYQQKVQQQERARQRLMERIVDSQEEERKHISRELHDEVGQSLMALLLLVQGECRYSQSADACCPVIERKIRQLAEEIHRLARGMRPSILDDYGLDSALASYLDEISRKSGIAIDYQSHFPSEAPRLPDRLEVTLYRIVQEAITNVLRHARATRASVVILRQQDDVMILVEDDGCGFDPAASEPQAESRLGLTGIKERAALFGGVCTVESEPGRGTTVRVKIPLREEELCLSAS